jgi:hydrogenase-4 component B
VFGVLYALMEHDLKRLLAYHTVENIGIIAIGLGAALLLGTAGLPAAAALALAAGLFHTLNHAVFKSLLFMGAGAILQATHTRDLEQMGGLIRRMPWTAATFLVGALAISGIPPLNGFASEWLTFQSLLALARAGTPGTPGAAWYAWEGWYAVGAVGAVALLGLTAALAVACFVKAFGGAFLALPRHRHAAEAVEAPVSMRWGMVSLAAACVALGLLSGGAFGAISAVAAPLVPVVPVQTALAATYTGTEGADGASATWSAVSAPRLAAGTTPGVFAAPALLALIASAGALGLILRRSVGRGARVRRAPTWVCGFDLQPHMEYTPTSFAEPIRVIFAWAVQPFRHTEVEYAPGTENYFVHTLRYHAGVHPPIERVLYQRGLRLVLGASHQLRRLQAGSLRLYLAYMLAALAALLAWGR